MLPIPGVSHESIKRIEQAKANALRNRLSAQYGKECVRFKHDGRVMVKEKQVWTLLGMRDDLVRG